MKQRISDIFHSPVFVKICLVLVAVGIFLLAASIFINSNKARNEQEQESQRALVSHTQTLNEIQQAVTELKNSNAADHEQTVKYINCVLVGVAGASSQAQALTVYQGCLVAAGVPQP